MTSKLYYFDVYEDDGYYPLQHTDLDFVDKCDNLIVLVDPGAEKSLNDLGYVMRYKLDTEYIAFSSAEKGKAVQIWTK